jgi:hypothetical protein
VKLGKSERTIRDFFSQLETSGYVSGDGRKPKTFTLLYDVEEIEKKLSGLLAKTESADYLTSEMEKETQEWCKKALENLCPVDTKNTQVELEAKTDSHAFVVLPSTGEKISNPSSTCSQPSSDETPSDNRQNQKLPINQTQHALVKGACNTLNGNYRGEREE